MRKRATRPLQFNLLPFSKSLHDRTFRRSDLLRQKHGMRINVLFSESRLFPFPSLSYKLSLRRWTVLLPSHNYHRKEATQCVSFPTKRTRRIKPLEMLSRANEPEVKCPEIVTVFCQEHADLLLVINYFSHSFGTEVQHAHSGSSARLFSDGFVITATPRTVSSSLASSMMTYCHQSTPLPPSCKP